MRARRAPLVSEAVLEPSELKCLFAALKHFIDDLPDFLIINGTEMIDGDPAGTRPLTLGGSSMISSASPSTGRFAL